MPSASTGEAARDATDAAPDPTVAPVIPLTSPTPMQRPAELPGVAAAPDAEPDGRGRPVRLRDVWAAARARRKALRAEVRRFTGRQRRRRALWLGGAASVVLLVLATLGAAYSPLFAVEQIRIVGARRSSTRSRSRRRWRTSSARRCRSSTRARSRPRS